MGRWRNFNNFGTGLWTQAWDNNTLSAQEKRTRAADQQRQIDLQSNLDPNRQLMGQEYFKDEERLSWRDNANELWQSEHGIDPRTGGITGPMGPIPHGIALQWQAIHDQAVWNARNRMAQEAQRYSQGAIGLMSSYRAGGGAAIQSNVYGQAAGVQLQRAQMLQPLDLLGDYRRDALAQAGSAGRDEQTIGTALQVGGALLSLVPGLGVVGAAVAVGGGALSGYGASRQNAAAIRAGGGGSTYGGQQGGIGAPLQMLNQGMQGGGAGGSSFAQQQQQNAAELNNYVGQPGAFGPGVGPTGPNTAPAPGLSGSTGPGYGFGEGGPSISPAGLAPEPGMKSMSPGGAGGPQQGIGGSSMAPPPVVGTDGRFDPLAYAQHGAAASPNPVGMQLAMSENMAYQIKQDPSWALITMSIDRELALRSYGDREQVA